MQKWIGKVAVVTGASSGIGKDISIRLVEHGLNVVGCSRNFENVLNVNSDISKEAKGTFTPFKCDVTQERDVISLFNFVKTTFSELSILINNAGLAFDSPILHGKTKDWRTTFETNIIGLCMCTREAFALIQKNEDLKNKGPDVPGHIININSIGGHLVARVAGFHCYCASKFAVTAITEGIRQELREVKSNVRVTQISPGYVDTEFAVRAFGQAKVDRARHLMPELLQASDVSDTIILTLAANPRSAIHDIIIRPTNQIF